MVLILRAFLIGANVCGSALALVRYQLADFGDRSVPVNGSERHSLTGADAKTPLCLSVCYNSEKHSWSEKCRHWPKCSSCVECEHKEEDEASQFTAVAPEHPAPLKEKFKGLHVALAWHGIYQRHMVHQGRIGDKFVKIMACSDFFHISDNVHEFILDPLAQAGATVINYVHTYTRYDCPAKDRRLIRVLNASRYVFWEVAEHRIVDSYIGVLRMVQEDKDLVDFVAVLRFDVLYRLPITHWNMTLDTIGVPFMDLEHKWMYCSQVSDLMFTLPTRYIPELMRALDWSAESSTSEQHTLRSGYIERPSGFCDHSAYHGSGHFVWQPLVSKLGSDVVRIMDNRNLPSDEPFETTHSFLGIDRNCSGDYFKQCPEANTDWVNNGLW